MSLNPILRALGYGEVRADAHARSRVLDLAYREGLSPSDFSVDADGGIRFFLFHLEASRLCRRCAEEEILGVQVRYGGTPRRARGLCRRWGLLLGAAVAVFLLLFSQRFVWSVEVRGTEYMTPGEVEAELRECGFGVGSYLPGARMAEVETAVLLASERLSWISIHMEGTVAIVQIIERVPAPKSETRPANLVASADGQIEQIELYRGNCLVGIGQAVRKGDLLVSGVYDSNAVGMRFTRASGRILARTSHELSVEVPLVYQKKVELSRHISEIRLNFFGFSIEIFKNSRNEEGKCDIIKRELGNVWIGKRRLPISITVEYRSEYELQSVGRSAEEAESLAYRMLEEALAERSDACELLRKEISFHQGEDSFRLICRIECIENIAQPLEFDVFLEP